jgi:iron-regulated transporter 1
MIQELEQVEIPASQRSTFAGTEQSICSMFELSHLGMTVLWSRSEDFKKAGLASWISIGTGLLTFGTWSRWGTDEGEGKYEGVPMLDIEGEED